MTDDQRRLRRVESLEKSFTVHVGEVHDHPQPIHLLDDFDSKIRQSAPGAIFPDAVPQLIAEIPGQLHRAKPQTVEIPQLMDAALKRHAPFEVQNEFDRARLDFIGQVAAGLDHRDHPFGARCFLQEHIDLIEGGFQITAGVLGVGVRVAANGIYTDVDAVADQSRCDGISYRRWLADGGTVELLVYIAMTFDNDMFL